MKLFDKCKWNFRRKKEVLERRRWLSSEVGKSLYRSYPRLSGGTAKEGKKRFFFRTWPTVEGRDGRSSKGEKCGKNVVRPRTWARKQLG